MTKGAETSRYRTVHSNRKGREKKKKERRRKQSAESTETMTSQRGEMKKRIKKKRGRAHAVDLPPRLSAGPAPGGT